MAIRSAHYVAFTVAVAMFLLAVKVWHTGDASIPTFYQDEKTPVLAQDPGMAASEELPVADFVDELNVQPENSNTDAIMPDINVPVAESPEIKAAAPVVATPDTEDEETQMTFLQVATKYGTDKVNQHHYNFLYEKYLEPMRNKKFKMLEIGLGCNMGYGPGASYGMWLEFFPNVDLHFMEIDGDCVEKWRQKTTGATIHVGDQANATFLEEVMHKAGGHFDIIIDDGGHTMVQQIVSLNTLWKHIKPKGIYFCEDLATSYEEGFYGGGPNAKVTMYGMIKELLDDINWEVPGRPAPKHHVAKDMRSIECGEQICAFFKR